MERRAFLTVDSGGSKTRLGLYGFEGSKIKETAVKGFGLVSDSEEALDEALPILFDFCQGYSVAVAVCNLGGKNKRQMEITLKRVFTEAKIRVFRESEGTVGLELCKKYGAQVTLMAGTGTIAIAPCGDRAVISGGWGANISDKGSGYQLGLDAIRLALDELDGTEPLSLLTKTLTGIDAPPEPMSADEYCDFRDGVRKKLQPLDRAHIASFAKTVYACAKAGDTRSLDLFDKVGCDLAETILAASRKANVELTCAVVNGGMVNCREFWQDSFEKRLEKEGKSTKIHYLTDGIDEVMRDLAKNILKGEK